MSPSPLHDKEDSNGSILLCPGQVSPAAEFKSATVTYARGQCSTTLCFSSAHSLSVPSLLPETDGPLTAEDSAVTYSQAFADYHYPLQSIVSLTEANGYLCCSTTY